MSLNTDYLRLSEHKIFKTLLETLPKNIKTAENVLVIKDDVLFTWDFQSSCVLTLNVKFLRTKESDNVIYQTLLPTSPPLFTPNILRVNDDGTLLAVAGPNGILVFELPQKCPPFGAFSGNKEVVYCRSHSLDERLLACSMHTEVRQVKFHPGSSGGHHLAVLTSDNALRFYKIENSAACSVGVYRIGRQPMGFMPGTNRAFLESLGDTAVDFDFGNPEIPQENTMIAKFSQLNLNVTGVKPICDEGDGYSLVKYESFQEERTKDETIKSKIDKKQSKWNTLQWPVYILRGDGTVFAFLMSLYEKGRSKPILRGPLRSHPENLDDCSNNACAIICLKTTPGVVCVAKTNGEMSHFIVLPTVNDFSQFKDDDDLSLYEPPDRTMYNFETVELELGLATAEKSKSYYCPIFLHHDESNVSRYFATHNTGVHSVTIPAVDELQKFIFGKGDNSYLDLLKQTSAAEYLVCTKTASSEKLNPIIGFTLYYDPISVVSLLADGQILTLNVMTSSFLPIFDEIGESYLEEMNSPLKKMLREPFDQYIQKILKRVNTQPILKLSANNDRSQEECYELLQRAAKVFREEYFQYHDKAREEIEKRVKALKMLKKYQESQVENMNKEKLFLKEKAEFLAEKYEDIKDKQDELSKRCEKLLITISQKKSEPSDAEKKFLEELQVAQEKIKMYTKAIEKIRTKQKYQEIHMENWKQQNDQKASNLNPVQTETIKANIQDMTTKIADMAREIKNYKKILNL